MDAGFNFATPGGQLEYKNAIEKEQRIRANWLAQYGPEEWKPAPRMVKVKKQMGADVAPSEAPPAAPAVDPPLTYQEVLKRMQFSTLQADSYWDMADTPVHNLAKQSIQFGQFNRRKSLHNL